MSGIALQRVNIYDGIPTHGNAFPVDVADTNGEQLITTTLPVTVLNIPIPRTGAYLMLVYDRVTVGSNSVLLVANWTDGSGAESFTIHSANHVVGSYPETPVYFVAVAGSTATLVATIGHANQVYITADVLLL